MALPENILTQLLNVPHETVLAQAIIGAVDLSDGESVPWQNDAVDPTMGLSGSVDLVQTHLALQYWPESVTDSRASEWSPKNIPGGSHPLYQWTNGGERRISFTAVFTTDTAPSNDPSTRNDPYQNDSILTGVNKGTRDLDIPGAISWLRYFTYPRYGTGPDLRAFEPPKCILVFPNSRMGHDGTDYIVAVMTQCDVTYEAWFPNGIPRIVEVQLEFAEVVQYGGRVRFHNRSNMTRSRNMAAYLKPRAPRGGSR